MNGFSERLSKAMNTSCSSEFCTRDKTTDETTEMREGAGVIANVLCCGACDSDYSIPFYTTKR